MVNMLYNVKYYLGSVFVFMLMLGILLALSDEAFAKSGFKVKTQVDSEFVYDSNVYKLSANQANKLEKNNAASQVSGRFTDMESVDDIIVTPRLKLDLKIPGLGGRDFKITPSVLYQLYMLNTVKNHFEMGLDLEQELSSNGSIGVEIDYALNVFQKNQLADAVDLTPSSPIEITPDERIYKPASYDDMVIDLTYRRRLWKDAKGGAGPLGINKMYGEVLVGYQSREYDDPFTNRNLDSIRVGGGLDLDLENDVKLAFSYLYEHIDTPVDTEVLLRDEPHFGVDLNGNGVATDLQVRTVQTVDRSRTEHTLGVKVGGKLNEDWSGKAGYEFRIQDYKSTEPFDITRLDREDFRHTVSVGAKRKFGSKWTLELEGEVAHEGAKRDALANVDPTESKSYDKWLIGAVLSYEL